jgi:DNA-binding transcriptional LysR family regulator
LTEAGLHYVERVGPALRDIEHAGAEIGDTALRPKGKLRLNALRAGHVIVIQPILQRFLRVYPEIEVEVVVPTRALSRQTSAPSNQFTDSASVPGA